MKRNEVIGQQEVLGRLCQMADDAHLPHAIMLCGPQGVGKLAVATAFASYLLGEDNAMVQRLEHPDLHFTYPTIKLPSMGSDHKPVSDDFAREWHQLIGRSPYFTLDQWLDAIGAENQQAIITAGESDELVRKLSLKSSQGGYKVSIVWLPERMNTECANKLLKLIEEPPSQTVFIMACEEPDKLLETIRSRVQRIDVRRLPTDVVASELTARRGIAEAAARRIARLSGGAWTTALTLLQADSENEQFLDLFMSLTRMAYKRDLPGMRQWTETLHHFGREKQKRFLGYTMGLMRQSFMSNFHIADLVFLTDREEQFVNNFAPYVNEDNILGIYDLISLAIRDIGQNANDKIVFFDLAMQMSRFIVKR